MKRATFAVYVVLAAACAPTQPAATTECAALSDCPLDQVCGPSRKCIAEPEDRFLGAFHCTVIAKVTSSTPLEQSEIIGRVGGDRFSLPSAFCVLKGSTLLLGFSDLLAGDHLTLSLSATDAATGQVTIGPLFDTGTNAATLDNGNTFVAFGYSQSGSVKLSSAPSLGAQLDGYVDITMSAPVDADALFGAPCPGGRGDCGKRTADVGGVALCTTIRSNPMCTRTCTGSGDCSLGDGTCVSGLCSKACTSNAGCTSPLQCVALETGGAKGCF